MTTVASAYDHLRTKELEGSRIPDFVLGALLPIPMVVGPFSVNMYALMGCLALATLRKPPAGDRLPWWYPTILVVMSGWMALSMLYNGLRTYQELGYFALWALTTLVIATGRLDRLSLSRGVGVGVVLGCLAGLASYYLDIGDNNYPGRLTGYIWPDPNQAGYFISVMGAIALVGVRSGWPRRLLLALLTLCLVLTWSRTSIMAMSVGAVWFAVRRRASPTMSVGIVALAAYLFQDWLDRLKSWGPFAERAGSDALRQRIDAAAQQLVDMHPWIGRGPGTAQVKVQERLFYFHNAYLAVRNNGGWVLLGLLLVLLALVIMWMLRLPPADHHPWHEAALIALLICATGLGEAFLRAPGAVAVGLAMRHAINPRELVRGIGEKSTDRVF